MLFYHQMSDSEQQRKKQKITAIKDEKKKKTQMHNYRDRWKCRWKIGQVWDSLLNGNKGRMNKKGWEMSIVD